jgi:post-segregation antitoxin (ccd killing protein)
MFKGSVSLRRPYYSIFQDTFQSFTMGRGGKRVSRSAKFASSEEQQLIDNRADEVAEEAKVVEVGVAATVETTASATIKSRRTTRSSRTIIIASLNSQRRRGPSSGQH